MTDTAAPSGTVTFLFTDLERSTQLWENHPDEMSVALARHDQIMRRAIEQFEGYVFSVAGDSFGAAFASVGNAVQCAVAMQTGVTSADWPAPISLSVRVGAHAGEAEERDGNYFGPHVNRAARLMSAANGGQILLSNTAAAIVGGGVAPGVNLEYLGEHRLKDVPTPEPIFAIRHADFPFVDRLPAVPVRETGNIPSPLTTFVGREPQLAALSDLITSNRFVTIVGPAGAGKTQTALEVCRHTTADFDDGQWLIELAPLPAGASVDDVVAAVLGPGGERTLDGALRSMQARRSLVVLDNCEHVLSGARQVTAQLLQRCPRVVVLCTSRQPLSTPGEAIFDLGPLSTAAGGADDGASEASTLFAERARAAGVTDLASQTEQIETICGRLGGLPLAIELASSRLRTMTVDELSSELDDQLRLLRAHGTDVDAEVSVESSIGWSYDLLPEGPLRQVFAALAVFAGPVTADTIAAVIPHEPIDTREAVRELADRSLLQTSVIHGRTMFVMLDSIRQYAAARLEEAGDAAPAARRRHLGFHLAAADRALAIADAVEGRRQLEPLVPELRAGIRWLRDTEQTGELPEALRILAEAARRCGRLSLEAGATRSALELAEAGLGDTPDDTELVEIAAQAAWKVSDLDAAVRYAERWAELTKTDATGEAQAAALYLLGRVNRERGDDAGTAHALRRLEACAATAEQPAVRARALADVAQLSMLTGLLPSAIGAADEAMAIAGDIGDDVVLIQAMVEKGSALTGLDEASKQEGIELLRSAYRMANERQEHLTSARALYNLADIVSDSGERKQIIELARAAALTAGHLGFANEGIEQKLSVLAVQQADLSAARHRAAAAITGRSNLLMDDTYMLAAHLAIEARDLAEARRLMTEFDRLVADFEQGRSSFRRRVIDARLALSDGGSADIDGLASSFRADEYPRYRGLFDLLWVVVDCQWIGVDSARFGAISRMIDTNDSPEALYIQAWVAEAQDGDAARELYEGVRRSFAWDRLFDVDTRVSLARLDRAAGDTASAIEQLDTAIELLRNWPGVRLDRVRALRAEL